MFEIIGTIATAFIVIAFLQSGELKIRILDLIGALLFIIYGILIHSFSTVLLNGILVAVQVYKLAKMKLSSSDDSVTIRRSNNDEVHVQ